MLQHHFNTILSLVLKKKIRIGIRVMQKKRDWDFAAAFARVYVLKSNQRRFPEIFTGNFLESGEVHGKLRRGKGGGPEGGAKKNERASTSVARITRYVIIFARIKSGKIENQSALGRITRENCTTHHRAPRRKTNGHNDRTIQLLRIHAHARTHNRAATRR